MMFGLPDSKRYPGWDTGGACATRFLRKEGSMCISSIQQCLPEEQRNSGELSALPTQQAREVEVAIRIAEFSARSKHPCDVEAFT